MTARKTKRVSKKKGSKGIPLKNPYTCKVRPESIEIRKGKNLVLAIGQGHDDIQKAEPGEQPVFQVGLVFDDDDHCDPADFLVRVVAVEQEREEFEREGYTFLIPNVDLVSEDWPTFTKLSKDKDSWAVEIEDAAFETFENVIQNFSEVEDPNPHIKGLIPYAREFEPQVRALVRRVMVNQILRSDTLVGSVFDHCAQEIVESVIDEVHDY